MCVWITKGMETPLLIWERYPDCFFGGIGIGHVSFEAVEMSTRLLGIELGVYMGGL